MATGRFGQRGGFTLVEVLIVVIIIGIVASAVLPALTARTTGSQAAVLRANLNAIQAQVEYHYLRHGRYPSTIEAEWFAGSRLPEHPQNDFELPPIQVLNQPGLLHPTNKVLKSGVAGAYWYNPAEGVIRARVADMGTAEATQQLYDVVNGSGGLSLGNYQSGGGGS